MRKLFDDKSKYVIETKSGKPFRLPRELLFIFNDFKLGSVGIPYREPILQYPTSSLTRCYREGKCFKLVMLSVLYILKTIKLAGIHLSYI